MTQKPIKRELGIACTRCGCRHFKTSNTEPLRDGRIRRRKICRHWGRKIVTFEALPKSVSDDCHM